MSLDVEASLREALRAEVGGMSGTPDIADVSRRVRRRRRQHRVMAVVPASLLILGTVAAVMSRRDDDHVAPAATSPANQPCVPSLTIPFRPGAVPAGWLMPSDNTWRLLGDAYVAPWATGTGMIEVWNGVRDDLPTPTSGDRVITVLGRAVSIGPISDGYSVAFDLGPTRCERWAIVAHPGVTEDELAIVAEGLQATP
jgi:hypothetical protein